MPTRGRDRARGYVRPLYNALAVLMGAPGADVFYDGGYLAGLTKDGSENVSNLASRIGVHTVASSGGNRPVWGATSPSGARGIAFTAASSHRLVDPLTTLGGLYDDVQAYSWLWVGKIAAPTTAQRTFSFGNAGSTTDIISSSTVSGTGVDRFQRINAAGGLTTNDGSAHSTAIVCHTGVFTGSAVSSWLNGTLSINAGANTRAPACDQFMIGALRTAGAYTAHFGGEFYALILSRSQWTTTERQALERAAKTYWGTP